MNEQQAIILDALQEAETFRADYWNPGPFACIGQALLDFGPTAPGDPWDIFGYPQPVCAALDGAAWTIQDADKYRTFAIAFFTEVPPQEMPLDLSGPELIEAAGWSVRRALEFCDPNCSEIGIVLRLLDEVAERGGGGNVRIGGRTLSTSLEAALANHEALHQEFIPRRLTLGAAFFALHALRRLQEEDDDYLSLVCLVTRDVARLAGLMKGAAGAGTYCIRLARFLGM